MIKKVRVWVSMAITYVIVFGPRSFINIVLDDYRENKLKRQSF